MSKDVDRAPVQGPAQTRSPPEDAQAPAHEQEAGNAAAQTALGLGQGGAAAAEPDDGEVPYQAEMEAAFGADLSGVKVQVGSAAPGDAGAVALAQGDTITFAEPNPDKETVAHEVAHYLQREQQGGSEEGVSSPDDASEREAEQMAARAAAGQQVGRPTQAASAGTMRKTDPVEVDVSKQKAKIKAFTIDAWGTYEEKVYAVLEGSSPSELRALARDQEVIAWIEGDFSGGDEAEAMSYLRPFMGEENIGTGAAPKTPRERIKASTIDTWGGDFATTVDILESLTPNQRLALGNDEEVRGWLHDQFGGAELDRILGLMMPQEVAEAHREAEGVDDEQADDAVKSAASQLLTDLKSKKGGWDDDEEGMVGLCEAFGQDHAGTGAYHPALGDVRDFLQGELSAAQYTRAIHALNKGVAPHPSGDKKPGSDDDGAAKDGSDKKEQLDDAALVVAAQELLRTLQTRKGAWDDDEDQMLKDVKAFAKKHAPIEYLWLEPMKPITQFLHGELSRGGFETYEGVMKGEGGKQSLESQVRSKRSWLTEDEDAMLETIAAASPADRKKMREDTEFMTELEGWLSPSQYERAKKLLESGAKKSSGKALKTIYDELDAMVYSSDENLLDAIDDLDPADVVQLKQDQALVAKIKAAMSPVNHDKLTDLLGGSTYDYSELEGAEREAAIEKDAEQLKASKDRLRARIRRACLEADTDEDAVYTAIMEFQEAGGEFKEDDPYDRRVLSEIKRSLDITILAEDWEKPLRPALLGEQTLHQLDRLSRAVRGLATDDATVDTVIKKVTSDKADTATLKELIRDFSNLGFYRQLAEQYTGEGDGKALAEFVPEINYGVQKMLYGDRDDAVHLISDLREAVARALEKQEIKNHVIETYGYHPKADRLLLLKYFNARELHEQNHSSFHDFASHPITQVLAPGFMAMDFNNYSGRDDEEQSTFAQHQADKKAVFEEGISEDEKSERIETAEGSYKEYKSAADALRAARAAAGEMASAVVGIVVAAIGTAVTLGSGSAVLVPLLISMSSAVASEVTKAIVTGKDYSVEDGAQKLAVALVTGVAGAGLGKAAEAASKGLGRTALLTKLQERVGTKYPHLLGFMQDAGQEAVGTTINEIPTAYLGELIQKEGLLREEWGGLSGVAQAQFQAAGGRLITAALQRGRDSALGTDTKLKDLTETGDMEGLQKALMKKAFEDQVISLATESILAGQPLDAEAAKQFIVGFISIPGNARIGAKGALDDAASTLEYINGASPQELAELPYITPPVAQAIVDYRGRRQGGRIAELGDLRLVNGFRDDVMKAAALDLQAEREEERAQRAEQGAGQPTPAEQPAQS